MSHFLIEDEFGNRQAKSTKTFYHGGNDIINEYTV